MVVATVGDPQTLDPRHARDLFSVHHVHLLYEGLFSKDEKGNTLHALCDSYLREGLTYQFHIRDAHWSNGEKITAFDVERSWRSVMGQEAPFAYQFLGIETIVVENPEVLRVTLKHQDSTFLELLTTNSFFPVHTDPHVYSGAYLLEEWIPHRHLILKKNPYYWDASSVTIEKIQFEKLQDMVALRLFEQGKIDWIGSPLGNIPLDALPFLKEEPHSSPTIATRFVRVNVERVPLDVRCHLASQLDRKMLLEVVSKSNESEAFSFLPPQLMTTSQPHYESSVEEMKPLILLYIPSEVNHLIAQLLERQLSVVLKPCNVKEYYAHLENGDYDLALGAWYAGTWDPLTFLEVLKYPNETGWVNGTYQTLLDEALLSEGPKKEQLLQKALDILAEELPVIPLYYPSFIYFVSKEFKHLKVNPLGFIDFR